MRFLVAAALLILVATGCTARTAVDVTSRPDGSGAVDVTLTLDAEAAERAGDLDSLLRVDDLTDAGWQRGEIVNREDGGRSVTISHAFASPAEGTAVLQQLTGGNGAFRNLVLTQTKSALQVDARFSGTVDLSQGIESFGDDGLAAQLGSRLGFDVNEEQTNSGASLAERFPIDLTVQLPGSPTVQSPPSDGGTWHLAYGEVTNFDLQHQGTDRGPIVLIALGVLFVLGIGAVLLFWSRSNYVPRHGR